MFESRTSCSFRLPVDPLVSQLFDMYPDSAFGVQTSKHVVPRTASHNLCCKEAEHTSLMDLFGVVLDSEVVDHSRGTACGSPQPHWIPRTPRY